MTGLAGALEAVLVHAPAGEVRRLKLRLAAPAILGPELERRARLRLDGEAVVVELTDPRWAREVLRLEGMLRRRIEAAIGSFGALEVRQAEWKRPRLRAAGPAAAPAVPEAVARAASRISDPALAERFARVAAGCLATRAERKAKRW